MQNDRLHNSVVHQPTKFDMEHDTEHLAPDATKLLPKLRPYRPSRSLQQMHTLPRHASWPEKSKSQQMRHAKALGNDMTEYHHHYGESDEGEVWLAKPDSAPSASPLSIADDTSRFPPFASPGIRLPPLGNNNESVDHDLNQSSTTQGTARSRSEGSISYAEGEIDASMSVASSENLMIGQSGTNYSDCVPVLGRLADLPDNDFYPEGDADDDEQGGIVILDESTEEEYDESMRGSQEHGDSQQQSLELSQTDYTAKRTESHVDITQASMYENDSIVLAAAARVNANPIPPVDASLLDFEQLLQEADLNVESNVESDGMSPDAEESKSNDALNAPGQRFWPRNPFSPLNKHLTQSRPPPTQSSLHSPVRATRLRHDKYVVEVDVFPLDVNKSWLDTRDVMDVMSNIELLHLWFDPVPAVFDATLKDGSGSSILSSQLSPSNSDHDSANNRQYDGQWVEISTPLLTIPPDSRLSGCLRAIRVGFRSMIGFPARIRSMVFVERGSGRIGMTLGPYPDGFFCQEGTMAYHTFRVRMGDEESGTVEGRRRCVVISDEVRLQRGGSEGFDGTTGSCCICSIFRYFLGLLELALLFRWYRPDLASYMQQSISSMDKLRTMVERGESAAHVGGELILDGNDSHDESASGALATPLLG